MVREGWVGAGVEPPRVVPGSSRVITPILASSGVFLVRRAH